MASDPRQLLERAMMEEHEGQSEAFLAHRVALLHRDLERAMEQFDAFRGELVQHAVLEELYVFPLYAEHGGDQTNSPTAQLLKEHDKLRAQCSEHRERLAGLREDSSDERVLAAIDASASIRALLEHHDMRERDAVYPFLSRQVTAERQAMAWAAIRDHRS